MAVTLQTLQNDVLNRLNEALNSPAGALVTGVGGTPTQATPDTITGYLNEAAADLARTCWPLRSTASATIPVGSPTAEYYVPFNTLANTAAGGGNLWAADNVYYGTALLVRISRKLLNSYQPTYPIDPVGVPAYWFPAGIDGIGIAAKPSASTLLTIAGLALPPPLVNPTDTVTWLDSDLTRYLSYYAAYYLAVKNMEDPSLSNRAEKWLDEYKKGQLKMGERSLRTDPATMAQFFPEYLAMRGARAA